MVRQEVFWFAGTKDLYKCWIGRRASFLYPADSGMWKMGLFGCLRVFMARLPEKKGSVCGKKLGQLEEFGKNLGV